MNINLIRLRPVIREIAGIRRELERMNDMRELELANNGLHVRPHTADTRGAPPETMYTDEEQDAIREAAELFGKIARQDERDDDHDND